MQLVLLLSPSKAAFIFNSLTSKGYTLEYNHTILRIHCGSCSGRTLLNTI